MNVLITGCCGFIGFHLAQKLLSSGETVIGVDNLNSYYDINLKKSRLAILKNNPNFTFIKADISKQSEIAPAFEEQDFTHVVNLAAQAGVRYSLTHPESYIESNLVGFGNILELSKNKKIENLVFASSSSVYGANQNYPFSSEKAADHPISLYAATKKSNELMAHSYAHLFKLPCTGLRFFTVYGPWGRPDMALFKFTKNIIENKPIDVYNNGNMSRDFTYVDDVVEGIVATLYNPAKPDPAWDAKQPKTDSSNAPYRIYNIGSNHPISLMEFIHALENTLNKKAQINFLPMQPGDVEKTYADTTPLKKDYGFTPKSNIETGIKKFVDWYLAYYVEMDRTQPL